MDIKTKRFWNAITILNLFLSIMICLYHNNGYAFYDDGYLSQGVKNIIDIAQNGFLANIPVPLFIFLSAFLFYRNVDRGKIKSKMISRVRSLVIPYICWNFITGGVLLLMQSIPAIRLRMAVREMALFDLGSVIRGLTIAPYDAVLWTILQLIIFVVLSPIIYFFIKNKYVGFLTLVVAFAVGLTDWNIPLLVHGNMHLFTYVLGGYIGLHWFQKIYEFNMQKFHYICALLITVILCILYEYGIYNVLCQAAGFGALYALAYFIADYAENCSVTCYGLSFWIYAMHNWLQPCIMKLWLLTGIKGNIGALISMFVCAFITIFLCIFCAKICKKLMPKVYLILSGGRG